MARKFFVSAAAGFAVLVVPVAAGQATAAPAAAQAPAAATVCYDASGAPSFASAINAGAANWNSAVSNVKLQSCSGATLRYVEGNDPQGSYAETDGHGSGTIFLDYTQAQQYDNTRIAAHETGHALGLPDHYQGPCSELMSGGGPGPSCTNANPNAQESSRVNSLWANGLAAQGARATQRIYENVPAATR
ncbi:snapalysin family zinc-dependent metalloprotease [Amycolatopsis sp. H20-H5]|uniref:snapalysin family zinc-dependent metalloprotease n=1 Tax=Amycolatopsis sp. H20-H5 TaxID=3046309 RepID=UPI002DBCB379|nr:snapalysin family zinc-dependent metalloprotease [Amycolatopsis sp. H20-H5]MEC3976053.1 snapalysin family zinc-dependent metalloprotease [Amycolatopsis sp. H20-H5]